MVIQGKKGLNEYKYLVMFDLASHNTGVCLWNIENNIPMETFSIVADKVDGIFVSNLYKQLDIFFNKLLDMGIKKEEVFVSKEAMPVQLRGGSSTVQTFIAMAKAHAILDLFLDQHDIDVYDYKGVYPATTHAYLKKLLGEDVKKTVDKKDIKEYVTKTYGIEVNNFDESDAAFLAATLVESKWDKDIQERIKEVKRHKKELKMKKAIQDCDDQIAELEKLLR